jgi:hypothetical protein
MQSTIDSSVITLVSVVATALVSILSVFVPVLVDWWKAKRQEKAAQAEETDKAALGLLANLAPFRHAVYNDIGFSAERDPVKLHSDLQVSHYAWERAVWPRLDDKDRDRVRKLRETFETVRDPSEYTRRMQELSDEILAVTYIASRRV